MFDRIVDQSQQLGLTPPQTRQLLGMLVARVFSDRHGGPGGFVVRLREQGLGESLDSWLGPGENRPIDADRIDAVLGAEHVLRISERLDLPPPTVRLAAAAVLPEVVHELSEHGDLPASSAEIPAGVHGWFGNLQDHLAELSHLGGAAIDAGAATLGASVGVVGHVSNVASDTAVGLAPEIDLPARTRQPGNPGRSLAAWLAAVVALVLGLALVRGCSERDRATALDGSGLASSDLIA